MWNMLKGNTKRYMLPERGFKPLKALQKITRSRCVDMGRRYHCLIIGRDLTSLLITKMGRDLGNKTMAAEYAFSKISIVGNDQEGIYNYMSVD
jgi:hypothetical protein